LLAAGPARPVDGHDPHGRNLSAPAGEAYHPGRRGGHAMRSYLVVANETLLDDTLLEAVRAKQAAGPSRFHLLVPATHPKGQWTEGSIHAVAEERLAEGLRHFQANGVDVTGEVGDANPVHAVGDVVLREPFDE